MPDFNITTAKPVAPSLPKNNVSNNGAPIAKIAEKPLVRNIPPLTQFNSETGLLDAREDTPWGKGAESVVEEAKTETPAEKPRDEAGRYAKWKAEQSAKKEERTAQQIAKKVAKEALAQDLLRKGDLVGAAKALNMSPSDLATYVDNARLQIPNPEKKLSPEEQYKIDEKKFRDDRLAFEQEQRDFKRSVIKTSYITNKIAPVVQDKETFEFIHLNDVSKIQDYIYEFMNDHYAETGEELNAKDVAETIEKQMKDTWLDGIKRTEELKAAKEYFGQKKASTVKTEEAEEAEEADNTDKFRKVSFETGSGFKPEPTLANKEAKPLSSRFLHDEEDLDDAEAEAEELLNTATTPKIKRTSDATTKHFAFLSKEERMALIRAGK